MYGNLKKMYRKTHPAMWNMAIAYLLDYGFSQVKEITDEQINTLEGNGLMTADFEQGIVKTAKAIAEECGNNVTEIIQFCMVEECFDTEWYKEEEG